MLLTSEGGRLEAIFTGTMIDNLVSRTPSTTEATCYGYYQACQYYNSLY